MGVSTEAAAPVDLNAIIQGGSTFLSRVKELQAAKDALDASLAQLNIGKDVSAALADAQKNQQVAKEVVAAAREEAEKITTDACTKAASLLQQASLEAEKTKSESDLTLATFTTDMTAARKTLSDWSSQVTKEAETLQKAAKAKMAKADAVAAENGRRSAEIVETKATLDQQMKAAKAAEENFKAKLAAIMAAAS